MATYEKKNKNETNEVLRFGFLFLPTNIDHWKRNHKPQAHILRFSCKLWFHFTSQNDTLRSLWLEVEAQFRGPFRFREHQRNGHPHKGGQLSGRSRTKKTICICATVGDSTKGDSEKSSRNFCLYFSKREKKNAYLEDPAMGWSGTFWTSGIPQSRTNYISTHICSTSTMTHMHPMHSCT